MLRFPNPSSDIDGIIRIFQALFGALSGKDSFSLDDISKTLVSQNLVASCGRMGEEALARSTRDDRSRDPLYNQSKQYTELYRAFGWIKPLSDSRLTFQFTVLGAYVYKAHNKADKLVKECILGIAFPNPFLNVRYTTSVRPFLCILKAMEQLDGYICRDEIILGPLAIVNDRNDFDEMIHKIRAYRKAGSLIAPLNQLYQERKITPVTAGNYTRFPLGILKWSGWALPSKRNVYGTKGSFYDMTDAGKQFIRRIKEYKDFRANDFAAINDHSIKKAIVTNSFLLMLQRSDFDISPILDTYKLNNALLLINNINVEQLVFSPFQELSYEELSTCSDFQVVYRAEKSQKEINQDYNQFLTSAGKTQIINNVNLKEKSINVKGDDSMSKIWNQAGQNIRKAASIVVSEHGNDNKDVFYPLVAKLFTLAGFPCVTSRMGVNYQRWDASIELNGIFLPIEIKSPGEEKQISIKAIRQAAENHIILLSRLKEKAKETNTSLAVCYQYPNDRAEVSELINDFYQAFKIKIGVIDLFNLAIIAFANLFTAHKLTKDDLENSHGFIDVNV